MTQYRWIGGGHLKLVEEVRQAVLGHEWPCDHPEKLAFLLFWFFVETMQTIEDSSVIVCLCVYMQNFLIKSK